MRRRRRPACRAASAGAGDGQRLRCGVPHGHYKEITLVVGLRLRGVIAPKAYDHAMNAETFEAWLEHTNSQRRPQFEVIMLDAKRGAYLVSSEPAPTAADEPSAAETIARGLGIVRRQIFVVLAFALLGVALGGIYVLKAPPKYTATVTLLADTRKIELVEQSYSLQRSADTIYRRNGNSGGVAEI